MGVPRRKSGLVGPYSFTYDAMTVIYVVTTGGTIEKAYSEQNGLVANLDSKIDRYLRLLRLPDCDVRVVPLMNIDSLEMNDSDRALILGNCEHPSSREGSYSDNARNGHDG